MEYLINDNEKLLGSGRDPKFIREIGSMQIKWNFSWLI